MKYYALLIFFLVACGQEQKTKGQKGSESSLPSPTINVNSLQNSIIIDTIVFGKSMINSSLLTHNNIADELNYYRQFIQQAAINDTLTFLEKPKNEGIQTTIRYFGLLHDLNGFFSYHVLTRFSILGIVSHTPKGVSSLVFINEAQTTIRIIRMNMPQELPLQIQENQLYFEYKNQSIYLSILGGIPPFFCIPKIGCYD